MHSYVPRLLRTGARQYALAGLLAAFVVVALSIAGTASATTFGGYELNYPCCNSEPLLGTRANISIPSSDAYWDPYSTGHCIAARSDAETGPQLIQTGFVRCAPGQSVDQTCSLYNNLVDYVEYDNGSGATCIPKGAETYGTTHRYTVDDATGSGTWTAYIDGVADPHTITMNAPDYLVESGEYTGSSAEAFSASATYGSGLAWERWNGSTWYTVQSAYVLVTAGSGWSVLGGPPNAWSVVH